MAISPEQSLLDLAARTATADSDLIHVNSGGVDYKESKADFLKGDFQHSFNNTSTLTSQVDALSIGTYFGGISGYGKQTETGLPVNANCYVKAQKYISSTYSVIEIWSINNAQEQHWIIFKNNGTWGSWEHVPARSEITSLNSSLAKTFTIHGDFTFTAGACVVQNSNVSSQARMFINQCYTSGTDLSPKTFLSQPSATGFNLYCRKVDPSVTSGWSTFIGTLTLDILIVNP